MDIIWRALDKGGQSILDVGCGRGQPMEWINRRGKFFGVGIDLFAHYIEECRKRKTHKDYIISDARYLPIKKSGFDVVLCLQVIEYLRKDDGLGLIKNAEEIARRQVLIATPVGFMLYCPLNETIDYDNPLLAHQSGWTPEEFRRMQYMVRGQGLRTVYGYHGLAHRLSWKWRFLSFLLSYLLQPMVYYFVSLLATHMICNKRPERTYDFDNGL